MQRVGHQRSVTVRASSISPNDVSQAIVTVRLLDDSPQIATGAELPVRSERGENGARQQALESAIRQRIDSRLAGRVRNLAVRVRSDLVVLEGECNTFYTKQLAQHAAMGILEDEHLENAIVVCPLH
jgi:hypothetical protein